MKRKIETFEVPVTKDANGIFTVHEAKKQLITTLSEVVEIESAADIQRLAVEVSQENTRAKEVADSLMMPNGESTIQLKYLI